MYPVSIILPVYNGIKFLEQSVNSVLFQNFKDFEFLILDDCSTDGSLEYIKSIKDDRVKIFQNSVNRGLFFNLNFLINKSSGAILKLWSQDDVMYPECIEEIVKFHDLHPGIGFSYTGRHYINEFGKISETANFDDTPEIVSSKLHTRIAFFTGSIAGNIANTAINRKTLEKVGLFNEKMKISGDFEMWVRLAQHYNTGFINKPLLQLRNHKGQLSGQEQYLFNHLKEDMEAYKILFSYIDDNQRKEGMLLMRNNKLLFYYTLMVKFIIKGNFRTGWVFCKTLHQFDNILVITFYFVVSKFLKPKKKHLNKNIQ
jgi:glycosyltransferase involved in cell wall biosynthesis